MITHEREIEKMRTEIIHLAFELGKEDEAQEHFDEILAEHKEYRQTLDEEKIEGEIEEAEIEDYALDETLRENMATEQRHGI